MAPEPRFLTHGSDHITHHSWLTSRHLLAPVNSGSAEGVLTPLLLQLVCHGDPASRSPWRFLWESQVSVHCILQPQETLIRLSWSLFKGLA